MKGMLKMLWPCKGGLHLVQQFTFLLLLIALPVFASGKAAASIEFTVPPSVSFEKGLVVIRWQTNSMADTRLLFGVSEHALNARAGDIQYTRQHQVRLAGLEFGQRYYYRVESSNPGGQKVQSAVLAFDAPAAAKVQLNVEGIGKVEGPNLQCETQCSRDYTVGRQLTLVATPAAGQQFAGWQQGCAQTQGNRCTVELNADMAVLATFTATHQPELAPEFRLEGKQPMLRGGGAAPGQQINIYANNRLIGTVFADANGNWSFDLTKLPSGTYQVTYRYLTGGSETADSPPVRVKLPGKKRDNRLLFKLISVLKPPVVNP